MKSNSKNSCQRNRGAVACLGRLEGGHMRVHALRGWGGLRHCGEATGPLIGGRPRQLAVTQVCNMNSRMRACVDVGETKQNGSILLIQLSTTPLVFFRSWLAWGGNPHVAFSAPQKYQLIKVKPRTEISDHGGASLVFFLPMLKCSKS